MKKWLFDITNKMHTVDWTLRPTMVMIMTTIAQLTYFSNVQSSKTYWQKLMINDRSHSNFLKVNRLTPQKATDVLRDQRGVDEYLLNENYCKIKNIKEFVQLFNGRHFEITC